MRNRENLDTETETGENHANMPVKYLATSTIIDDNDGGEHSGHIKRPDHWPETNSYSWMYWGGFMGVNAGSEYSEFKPNYL